MSAGFLALLSSAWLIIPLRDPIERLPVAVQVALFLAWLVTPMLLMAWWRWRRSSTIACAGGSASLTALLRRRRVLPLAGLSAEPVERTAGWGVRLRSGDSTITWHGELAEDEARWISERLARAVTEAA